MISKVLTFLDISFLKTIQSWLGLYPSNICYTGKCCFKLGKNSRIYNMSSDVSHIGRILGLDGSPYEATVITMKRDSVFNLDGAILSRGCKVKLDEGAELTIKEGTYISSGSLLGASKSIKIGSKCSISWGVTIIDDDGHKYTQESTCEPVEIGNNVWIGCNSTILKGVSLGDNTVVAAGSVVTKSFPENSIIGGVPAKPLST